MKHIVPAGLDRELKKGSAELMILSLVETRARHGYEISRLIDERSDGRIRFKVASLYPMLYRLEARGWLEGRWIEKPGERRVGTGSQRTAENIARRERSHRREDGSSAQALPRTDSR